MDIITNIPEYEGIGIYALIDNQTEKRYIGSSKNVNKRIKQHIAALRKGKASALLNLLYRQGHTFRCELLEKIDYGVNSFYVFDREQFYISKYDTIQNGLNTAQTTTISEQKLIQFAKEDKSGIWDKILQKKRQPIVEEESFIFKLKGKRKNIIRDFAAAQGDTLNGFINKAIDEKMSRDKVLQDF